MNGLSREGSFRVADLSEQQRAYELQLLLRRVREQIVRRTGNMEKQTRKRRHLRAFLRLGIVAGLAAGLFLISPFPLYMKCENLRSRRDAPEIGAAMARLTEIVKDRGYLMRDDPRFPPELKRIRAGRVFVNPAEKFASVYFGCGFFGFGYTVQATDPPGAFRMKCWSDGDYDPPTWTIKP